MIGVEEARHVEIGADILDHDIGRVAPAADGDVAIGQGEALERGRDRRCARPRRWSGRECDRPRVSIASARARSARSVAAMRCCPAARAVAELRSAAPRAGPCRCRARSRFRATAEADSRRSNRAARCAWASVAGAGRRRARRAAGDQGEVRRWRRGRQAPRGGKAADRSTRSTLRHYAGGRVRSVSTFRQLPSTPVMRTRSPGCGGTAARVPFAVADPHAAAMLVDRGRPPSRLFRPTAPRGRSTRRVAAVVAACA